MSTITKIPFSLGEPQVADALAVFPVFGDESSTAHRALAAAVRLGAYVKEIDDQGSVGQVTICNTTDHPLLVYEGEQIEGARQNRCFDAHTLVPPGVELFLGVSCVEKGRWEGRLRAAHFSAAAYTPDPEMRRTKRARINRCAADAEASHAVQHEVWDAVSARLSEHQVSSPSASLSDVFHAKRDELATLHSAIHCLPGQLGALVEVSGHPVALDLTGKADVFAELLPRLSAGYALQALNARATVPDERAAQGFLGAALDASRRWRPTAGMGDGFAVSQAGLEGLGLAIGPELIALAVFPAGQDPAA